MPSYPGKRRLAEREQGVMETPQRCRHSGRQVRRPDREGVLRQHRDTGICLPRSISIVTVASPVKSS